MDFAGIVKESPGLCRCCLSEGCYKDLSSEYTWMDDTEVYADMLLECFDISISQHIEGPNGPNRLICEVCITRLRDACNFKKQVLDSEKKFVDMVGRGEFKSKVVVYEDEMKTEMVLEPEAVEETEIEYLDEDMDYDDGNKDDLNEPSVSEDITVDTLPIKGKRGRTKKSAVKPEKKTKLEEKAKPKIVKDERPYDQYIYKQRRENLQILFNNSSIIPFKWSSRYLCFYCGQKFKEYPTLRNHTKSHGPCSTSDYALKFIRGHNIEIKIDVSEIQCEICNEPFSSSNEIIDHLIDEHELKYDKSICIPFEEYRLSDCCCQLCGQEFSYFGFLISHMNIEHPQNSFICDNCGEVFNKMRDLKMHIRYYHREGGYPCDECAEVFETYILLRKHRNRFHFQRCKMCDLHFSSYALLRKHIKSGHPDDGCYTKCPLCSEKCLTSPELDEHIRKCKLKRQNKILKATIPDDNILQPNKKQNVYQIRRNIQCVLNMSTAVPFKFFVKFSCFYCSKYFVEFDELKEHVSANHPFCDIKQKYMRDCKGGRIAVKIDVSSLACKLCLQPMGNVESLIDHLISKHEADYDKSMTVCFEPFKIKKDKIPCPTCSKVFRYFGTLLRHMNSEHSTNNIICDFCGRSFKSLANLKVHVTHAHTGSCECEICGTKYKNQWCLGRHMAKSHNVKDFQCTKCPERFQSQYHKQKHLITVHDIGHKCTYCGKMFTRNSFMKDHIRRTHLKEKDVPCTVCGEKFFDNYCLKLHMVKHKGERNFTCEVCGKAFLRRSNLKVHKQMHKKHGHA